MSGKKMEGDEAQRRRKARAARKRGAEPSAESVTGGASKQRHHLPEQEEHPTKIETIRKGKQRVIGENTPKPRPGSRGAPRQQ